ncbi:MAG: HAD-IIIC family phosphatase [Acutalibacteraceae bacterium]|nr:HAD-IIIC family phosphatase [Acutalibacteraceae bacterium]
MKELEYPFDEECILRKKKKIKRELLKNECGYLEKKIAILGGSTTSDIKLILELFLLNYGIKPVFYESEYNQFYEDAIFGNEKLDLFKPDIVFIHTSNRNIINYPKITDSKQDVDYKLNDEFERFLSVWRSIEDRFECTIIQNNFEYPFYRLLGNKDATDIHGRVNFITRLNLKFAEYAEEHNNFFIHDINYLSSQYGLDKWSDEFYWYMYKYALAVPAIPCFAYSVANIIKAIYGKNKKALALDLDNTLWGGIVGDDGVENLAIGQETAKSEAYTEFQEYLKEHKQLGVLLNINSKNEMENALAGLSHPEGVLKKDDFVIIKANWSPKSQNLQEIADELNIGIDSIAFIDDNPAEREIINQTFPVVATPDIGEMPEKHIRIIDRCGFFECVNISADDLNKVKMYQQNAQRASLSQSFTNYDDYLKSLNMTAHIQSFIPLYMQRIAQLTNKSNQFNLTTKRYTQAEIEQTANNPEYITLYGKLADKFGDNGVVSVVIGHINGDVLNIDLWIMSCRVLKRDMEFAMMDSLIVKCKEASVKTVYGYYYPTAKNGMVRNFYQLQGFTKIEEDDVGNSKWQLDVETYKIQNKFIKVED